MPLAAPFARVPATRVITVATILDDPDRPHAGVPRCDHCRRPVRTGLWFGLRPRCARRARGAARQALARRPKLADHAGPDLLDLLDGEPEDGCE